MRPSIRRYSRASRPAGLAALALSLGGGLMAAAPAQAATIMDTAGVAICCFATRDTTATTTTAAAILDTTNGSFTRFSPNYDPAYGASVGFSVNSPTNPTSGSASAFFPGLTGKYPYLQGANGSATASSDLLAGQLHAYAASEQAIFSSIVTPPGSPPPASFLTDYYSFATAIAGFSVNFNVSNSGADFLLPFSWQVDGSVTGPVIPYQARSEVNANITYDNNPISENATLAYDIDPSTGQILTSAGGPLSYYYYSDPDFADTFTATDLGGGSWLMQGLLDIHHGTGVGTLSAITQLACAQGTVCDFSHTSSLSLGALPTGVSFSFDTPGFLNGYGETAGGVPEPAAWAMLIMGLGGAGAMLRRRRTAQVPA